MTFSAFPWIGGKTHLCHWVLSQLPDHTTYVEPFGGSAAVLLNKDRSRIEVFNDKDGDVVQFFDVARRRPDELAEWCHRTPFSEKLHSRWTDQFYSGDRPDDELERAGRWLFLRYSQFAGKVSQASGFKRELADDEKGAREARNWASVPSRIDTIADRFAGVSVLNDDYVDVVNRYDGENTLFYVDPPYWEKEDLYNESADHAELAETLDNLEGKVMVSYTDIPPGLYEDWNVIGREASHNAGPTDKKVTERLICNFNPNEVTPFVGAEQSNLEAFGD